MDTLLFARFAQYFSRCCTMFPAKFPHSVEPPELAIDVALAGLSQIPATSDHALGIRLELRSHVVATVPESHNQLGAGKSDIDIGSVTGATDMETITTPAGDSNFLNVWSVARLQGKS
jgi:hypothetical protein